MKTDILESSLIDKQKTFTYLHLCFPFCKCLSFTIFLSLDSKTQCLHFSCWDTHKDWIVDLPKGEDVRALCLGQGWAAVATSAMMVRLFLYWWSAEGDLQPAWSCCLHGRTRRAAPHRVSQRYWCVPLYFRYKHWFQLNVPLFWTTRSLKYIFSFWIFVLHASAYIFLQFRHKYIFILKLLIKMYCKGENWSQFNLFKNIVIAIIMAHLQTLLSNDSQN